ncbi:hypothetical protein, partial [Mesorhizobium sp.]|uniref:hypothetical protein n=1 Tax=Mesorhizobium sp. TaxID=1871066 RepID=UPI0025E10B68
VTKARRAIDCHRYQIGIAPTQGQRAKHEKLAWFGIVRELGLGSFPASLASSHEPFEIGFQALVDAADVRLIEDWTIDLSATAKPEESRISGVLIHNGSDRRDAIHRQCLS